jgi:dethiobiotin synthetase
MNNYFITGIGTGIGKTITSAVLCEAFGYDYWKPIQAGSLNKSDSQIVSALISTQGIKAHYERYRLETPCSPHLSAELDEIYMNLEDFKLPGSKNGIIVEGAGGVLVPINEKETVLDLIKYLNLPVIVVAKNYLGSINHTLLTVNLLLEENVNLKGIIFNGEENRESEKIIKKMTGVESLTHISTLEEITKENVREEATRVRGELNGLI